MHRDRLPRTARLAATLAGAILLAPVAGRADTTPQSLPMFQDWSDTCLVNFANNWDGAPGFVGHRGDELTGGTGTNPQTITADCVGTMPAPCLVSPPHVIANTNDASSTTGGFAELELVDPAVAFQGSSTAAAPFLLLHLDTTGSSTIRVRYRLRDLDPGADNAAQAVALQYRVGASGPFTDVPAAFAADATTGGSATQVTQRDVILPGAVDNQPLVQLRWITANAVGADEWVGIDDIQVLADSFPIATATAATPALVNRGAMTTLTAAIDPGANPTVTVAADLSSLGGGATQPLFDDGTNGDPTGGDGTFTLQYVIPGGTAAGLHVVPLVVADGASNGTAATLPVLVGDTDLEIWEVQGPGATSPFLGRSVTMNDNLVTARQGNAFYIQTPDGRSDGDGGTSDGIFVFRSGSTPAVNVGDQVDITGNVVEFFGATEISGGLSITVDSTGNSLPTALAFGASIPATTAPACGPALERYEHMRATINGGRISAPNQYFASDMIAEAHAVAGPDRAFREPGIDNPGLPGLPLYDANPEVFELDVDKLGLVANLELPGGTTFDATGIVAYEFGGYELFATSFSAKQTPTLPRAVRVAAQDELTLGSLNMFRYFDDVDDPADGGRDDTGEVVSAAEYLRRRTKFTAYVRDVLRSPDVLAVQEAEKLAVLQALATDIATADPSVVYTSYCIEGNDVGQIEVGFMVRQDRVQVDAVTQLGKTTTWLDPTTNAPSLLHDRPPLLLEGRYLGDTSSPFAVLVVHQRSRSSIDGTHAQADRVQRKRLAQAQDVAQMVQDFQSAHPDTPLVVVGDFNAFEFTDGYADVVGHVMGVFDPNDELHTGGDLVDPDLTNQVLALPAEERYSFIFDGSAQVLDHALTSQAGAHRFRGIEYGRGNADAPRVHFDDEIDATALRSSDHDGFVLYLASQAIFADGFESGDTSAWSTTVP